MAYICVVYSENDVDFAGHLRDLLQNEGFAVWMDESELLKANTTTCAAFMIIMSPEARESDWVKEKLSLARQLDKPIFPILYKGEVWQNLAGIQHEDMRAGSQAILSSHLIDSLQEAVAESVEASETPPTRSKARLDISLRFVILFVWLVIGLYVGFAGWTRANIDNLKEIALTAPEKPIVDDSTGIVLTFRSQADRDAIMAQESLRTSIFAWIYFLPEPLPLVISAASFGVLGGVIFLFRIFSQRTKTPNKETLILRPIFGGLTGLLVLGLLQVFPTSFTTIDGKTLNSTTVLAACLIAGAFAEQAWKGAQALIARNLFTSKTSEENK